MTDSVRKKPAISHQPPWASGGSRSPYSGAGGSRASQNNCRTNWRGFQFTEASMFSPMISKARMKNRMDSTPVVPR
jgi:hypothetical protein